MTITGGTGRFRRASGTLVARTAINLGPPTPSLNTNGFEGIFFGSITPSSARSVH